jgi:TolB-like protein
MHAPFRSLWQRLVVGALAALAIGLIAAGPVPFGPPSVLIVLPFQVGPGLKATAGSDFATHMSATIAQTSGVTVVPDTSTDVNQADYPAIAKAAGADFYLTGFISPNGGTVTVIQQLVSLRSGTIVWSNSAQVLTPEDAVEQANLIRDTIVQYQSRGFAALAFQHATPPPDAKTTSRPVATAPPAQRVAAEPNLPNEAYGFSSAPTAAPKIYASAAHPSRYVILRFTGKLESDRVLDYTANALIYSLGRHGQTASLADPDTSEFPLVRGATICADTGASVLVWGSIATTSTDASRGDDLWTDATLTTYAWDCKSAKFVRPKRAATGAAGSWETAIDHASDDAVTNYLLTVPSTATS